MVILILGISNTSTRGVDPILPGRIPHLTQSQFVIMMTLAATIY